MYYINTLKQELSTAKTYEHNRLDETSVVDRHRCHMAFKFGVFVDEDHSKLPTLYCLPKRHTRPYKSRFIANSILEDFENASPYFCTFLANRICD